MIISYYYYFFLYIYILNVLLNVIVYCSFAFCDSSMIVRLFTKRAQLVLDLFDGIQLERLVVGVEDLVEYARIVH